MIYITRTIPQTHKIITTNMDTKLDKAYLDNDVNRDEKNQYHLKVKTSSGVDFPISELEDLVQKINNLLIRENSRFEFSIHERTNRFIVKLMDNDTGEVIKEIPPEKILDLVGEIWDFVGILVDERG